MTGASRYARIEDLTRIRVPELPAVSPDGRTVAYAVRSDEFEHDRVVRELWTVGAHAGAPRRLTSGPADSAPAWSPDGRTIAFQRSVDGCAQIWLLPVDGGEPRQLTAIPTGAGEPVWSPDGARIACVAEVADGDDHDSRPIVATRLGYKADGAGFIAQRRAEIHVIDVVTGSTIRLTDEPWRVRRPAWSPTGDRLVFPAARFADDRSGEVGVYLLPVSGAAQGSVSRVANSPSSVVHAADWSSSGEDLIVAGRDDAGPGHVRLHIVPVDGGASTELTAGLDRNVVLGAPGYPGGRPVLTNDGSVLFCARDGGATRLYRRELATDGRPMPIAGDSGEIVAALSAAARSVAVVLQTPSSFGELVCFDLDTGTRDVRTACDVDRALYPPLAREFTISDGTTVHGWVLRAPATTGPAPTLLDIHGGPHNAWTGAADPAHLYQQELVARGWTVLLLNPRGSDGYGESYFRSAVGAWGTGDTADLLEPLDALVADGLADPEQLAVAGYSYGGYMTCYLTSRDARFRAAVAGGAISDLVSMVGTSDCGPWLGRAELDGMPTQRPDAYRAMSPITHVDRVTTPTLVFHGADDHRCPAGQSEQWFTALRSRGVATQLVRYPRAGHEFVLTGRPSQRLDLNRRVVDWIETHVGRSRDAGARADAFDVGLWTDRLAGAAVRHGVPGAVLGVLRLRPGGDDELAEIPYGVLSTATHAPVTNRALFQLGSITKVWTTTVVMQLVDEGLLDLDTPVCQVLPELQLGDSHAQAQLTLRQLLTHTSGIDGDVFTDTGRGDDCLRRYVDSLASADQMFPPGATWSYCNSGFVLAGRLLEQVCGRPWDEVMRTRLFEPLGLTATVTLAEDALLHATAVGHVPDSDHGLRPAERWQLPRSIGPAGLITSSVADLLTFARLHLTGGRARHGTPILGAAAVTTMATKQVELPAPHTTADSWGLGWERGHWDGELVLGHDGNTIGQAAYLHIIPSAGLAVALLTNGGAAGDLHRDVLGAIVYDLTGLRMPSDPAPLARSAATAAYHAGHYERAGTRLDVSVRDGRSWLRRTATGHLADLVAEPVRESELFSANEPGDVFVLRYPGERRWTPVSFYAVGSDRYLHLDGRATPRIRPACGGDS